MGKMMIFSLLAVASGKIGGRSLAPAVTCDRMDEPTCKAATNRCNWNDPPSCTDKNLEEKKAFEFVRAEVQKANSTLSTADVIRNAATIYETVTKDFGTSGEKLINFFKDPKNKFGTFVNNALKVINDPDSVLAELRRFDYLNPNDALVTYLKNEENSVPKKIIFGAFCVHGFLLLGDIIITFAPIPNLLRSIAGWFVGSSSIFFIITNGVAVWAAYSSESLKKTKKYYYVAGIYFIVQAADIIIYFLGIGLFKIIYKFLSYGFKVVYLADAIIVTFIPLYFVYAAKPENFEAVAGEGWSWLYKQFR